MSDNKIVEVTSLTNKMCSRIEKNDYDGIRVDLTDESVATVLGALSQLAQIVGSVSNEVFVRVENIATNVIKQQVVEDCVKMQNDAEAMKRFNDRVDFLAKQLDLTNPVTVELFTKCCEEGRKDLELYFDRSYKPTNLWDRFLSVFRRH